MASIKAGHIVGFILLFLFGIGANILTFFGYFGAAKEDTGLVLIFTIMLSLMGLAIVVIMMIKEYQNDIVPWWLWFIGIVLNVLPFIELIILQSFMT